MKDISTVAVGILERIRRLAPEHVPVPYSTTEEWREWQLAEGRKCCEEINRRNRQLRVEKNPEPFGHPAAAPQMFVRELPGAERRAETCAEPGQIHR